MDNSLEKVLSSLLADSNSTKALLGLLSSTKEVTNDNVNTKSKSKVLQQKIDILKTIEPIIDEKNRDYIRFFIKALTVAKIISEIE